ncbi:hypothetical protein BD560DRAFT_487466 [Blakeslea trispora]|nr:hypothetical protein BD560DRAFT_487466 [Blakeslea trispora]
MILFTRTLLMAFLNAFKCWHAPLTRSLQWIRDTRWKRGSSRNLFAVVEIGAVTVMCFEPRFPRRLMNWECQVGSVRSRRVFRKNHGSFANLFGVVVVVMVLSSRLVMLNKLGLKCDEEEKARQRKICVFWSENQLVRNRNGFFYSLLLNIISFVFIFVKSNIKVFTVFYCVIFGFYLGLFKQFFCRIIAGLSPESTTSLGQIT